MAHSSTVYPKQALIVAVLAASNVFLSFRIHYPIFSGSCPCAGLLSLTPTEVYQR